MRLKELWQSSNLIPYVSSTDTPYYTQGDVVTSVTHLTCLMDDLPATHSKHTYFVTALFSDRFLIYNHSAQYESCMRRLKEALGRARCFVTVVMDEAHFAATGETGSGNISAYGKLTEIVKSNAENLLVLLVSATPFNAMTINRRFPFTTVQRTSNGNYRIVEETDRQAKNPTPLHIIRWETAHRHCMAENGMSVRLMAFPEDVNKGPVWLGLKKFKFQNLEKEKIVVAEVDDVSEAAVFTFLQMDRGEYLVN